MRINIMKEIPGDVVQVPKGSLDVYVLLVLGDKVKEVRMSQGNEISTESSRNGCSNPLGHLFKTSFQGRFDDLSGLEKGESERVRFGMSSMIGTSNMLILDIKLLGKGVWWVQERGDVHFFFTLTRTLY